MERWFGHGWPPPVLGAIPDQDREDERFDGRSHRMEITAAALLALAVTGVLIVRQWSRTEIGSTDTPRSD